MKQDINNEDFNKLHEGFLRLYYGKMDKPKTIILDMDEVLVDIAPVWVEFILANREIFEDFMDLDKDFNVEMIHNRDEYYIEKWLKKDNIEDIPEIIHDIFISLYMRDDFYDHCKPTEFAKAMVDFSNSDNCENIYVLSNTMRGHEDIKAEWLSDLFGDNDKIIYVPVIDELKSTVINKMDIEYDSFVDDKLENIIDVIKNTNSISKEFLLPKKGYNKPTEELELLIEALALSVSYYE